MDGFAMHRHPTRSNPGSRAEGLASGAGLSRIVLLILGLLALASALSACDGNEPWHETDITGAMPDLAFTMARAKDGKEVTAADYRGKVTMLYFGYTFCPDICPTTLANVAQVLKGLGDDAGKVRVLFVTVDPNRDTPKVLNQYTDAFAPQVDGLRGTPDQLAALARRYRVAYSVKASEDPTKYEVTHSPAIYVFGDKGKARLLIGNIGKGSPDLKGIEADLRRLIGGGDRSSWFAWLQEMV
jgi:protein SCO1/2